MLPLVQGVQTINPLTNEIIPSKLLSTFTVRLPNEAMGDILTLAVKVVLLTATSDVVSIPPPNIEKSYEELSQCVFNPVTVT